MLVPRIALPRQRLRSAAAEAPITVTGHRLGAVHQPDGRAVPATQATDDTLADWFGQADRNHDGSLTPTR